MYSYPPYKVKRYIFQKNNSIFTLAFMSEFNINRDKTVNSLLYISSRICNSFGALDKYKLLKLLYFSDRKHIARYGRPITGDKYLKLEHGPVSSFSFDIAKNNLFLDEKYRVFDIIDNTTLQAKIQPDLDQLSETDIECIEEAIVENIDLDFGGLKNKSHDSAYDSVLVMNDVISYLEIAKAEGADENMIDYIKLHSENLNCSINAPAESR